VSIDALITNAHEGRFPPVAVIAGAERLLVDRALTALKKAALDGELGGFNSDLFQGASVSAKTLINTARTLPMLAKSRFILVRNAEAIPASSIG
jgi:DNA polymerase III subunit delta